MNLQRLLSSDTSSPLSKVIQSLHHHQRAPSLSSVLSVDQVSTQFTTHVSPAEPLLPLVVRSSPARPHRPPCNRFPQKTPRRRQVAHLLLPVVRAPQHKPSPNRKAALWRQWWRQQWQWQRQRQVQQEKGGRLPPHRPIPVTLCHRVPCQGMSIAVNIQPSAPSAAAATAVVPSFLIRFHRVHSQVEVVKEVLRLYVP